ncbi:MAG: carboxypeptidase M32 [Phycisphaerae bacterium]
MGSKAASSALDAFTEHVRAIETTRSISSLLDWDQETLMPPRAAKDRANQLALLAGLAHERLTSDHTARLLESAEREAAGDPVAETNLREVRREYEREVKLPKSLVEEIAHAATLSKGEWVKARKESKFSIFAPHLSRMLELKRQAADYLGWKTERYDALMDEYEPGARASEVQTVFDGVKRELTPLLTAIVKAPRQPDRTVLERVCPVAAQAAFNRTLAESLGFDFDAGRIDISVHPFCGGSGPSDVRMTTRYDERYMPMSLFGVLHETGHALYEQGFDPIHTGTPMARSVSLGIHESQSRMWENLIGRSRAFWTHFYPALKAAFPSMADVSPDAWYFAINAVRPSFIRVEADEVTYGLHIMLRFDLERRMVGGQLAVQDVPAAWKEASRALLGITPPDDAQGCLQDIHWSQGTFGYFPTYALGNLYASQFFEAAKRAIPDLMERVARGELRTLLGWLRENIHRHGMRYRASELVKVVTGKPLSHQAFVSYLKDKFGELYNLA